MHDIQIAVLSDIHGNRWALEAVLADIERRSISKMVNLGDCFYGPLDPAGTARLLLELDIPTVCGNEDREILELWQGDELPATLQFTRKALGPESMQWLDGLKPTLVVDDLFFLCHGTPEQDTEYLLKAVNEQGVFLRGTDTLMKMTAAVQQPVILCGHDHVPQSVRLPDGRLIVNPGSVGLPAYDDDLPFPHIMETGTPHARYSIVSKTGPDWRVEDIAVPYDWEAASLTAEQNGRSDWARWLLTGRAVY